MIDLTVKTLDSQNHAFSLEDDQITVRGFKEHIAESVAVPADSQRLIYCGRVLQDEKKLNDYDVNGKVIHLVQRAPPQPGQRNNDSPQNQRQGQGMIWRSWQNVRHQMQGNTMYLGAMSVPAEVMMDGTGYTGMQVPQYSNTLATNRLNIARRMLNRINELLDRLDDPSLPLHPPAPEQRDSPPVAAQVHIQEIETESDDNEGGYTNSARFAQAASTAIAAALSAAGLSNVTLLQGSADESGNITTIGTAQEESSSESQQQPQQQQQQPQGESQDSASNSFDRQPNRRPTLQLPRPAQMADLLEKLTSTQNRLQPYIDRFRELMQADPTLPLSSGTEGVESNQKLVDGVSESLHFMSHALHALSDINVDMAQQAPRNLRCRSLLIQQSTILQAGIPIQVEAHISLNGRHANNNNSNEESNDSAAAQQSTDTAESGTASSEESSQQQESENGADSQTRQQPTQQSQPEASATPFGTLFNLPNNVEVLMEMSPESSRRDTLRGVTGESASRSEENQTSENNNNTPRGGVMGQIDPDIISWTASPAEVLRSVMQAATGQVLQANIASNMMATSLNPGAAAGQQSVSFSLDSANTNPGQSTQARSNVGTHPTTATQTRSTSRPHIFHQQSPLSVGMAMGQGGSMNFDPFLPCNSHHIRRNPPTTPNATSTPQQTRAGPSGSAPQETSTQAQSSTSASTEDTSASSTSTTSQSSAQADPTIDSLLNFLRRMSSSNNGGQSQANVNIPPTNDGDSASRTNANLLAEILGQGSSNSSNTRGLTLLELLGRRRMFFTPNQEPGQDENLFTDLLLVFAQNMTLEGLVSLKFGEYEPIANLRKPFREFLQREFSSASTPEALQEQILERLVTQLRPHLQHLLAQEEDNSGKSGFRVDLCATIESIFSRHTKELLHLLFHDKVLDPHFARQTMSIFRTIGSQLCAVLRYSLRGGQDGLENVAVRFLNEMVGEIASTPNAMALCEYMVELPFAYFRTYSRRISQPPDEDIIPLLVYKNISSQSTPTATTTTTTSVHQSFQSQPPVEAMEVETVEETPNNDQLLGDEDEEIPETFPGHEALPSDWVPIIARDGARQRRQLQMQGMVNGGVTTFSDAYLGGLPSKRRKLIEQQKPHLLVSSASNHSAIASSVERLVRDSVNRAGVEEVEGSVVAVAAASGVRRAFGQAIRDCLNPNRYPTPDFPDPIRFPNATKYFADKEKPSK